MPKRKSKKARRARRLRGPRPKPYPTAQEELEPACKPKRKPKAAARKHARKKVAGKASKRRPKAAKRASPRKRAVRRNPAQTPARKPPAGKTPEIEAAFYQLGKLLEFEFVGAGGAPQKFVFDSGSLPLLAADEEGRLHVVYEPRTARNGEVPASVSALHKVFNGKAADRLVTGVFGKKCPGTRTLGELTALLYFSNKCIDRVSCSSPGSYRHGFAAPFPKVLVNPEGLLLIEGGSYEITRAGIVN